VVAVLFVVPFVAGLGLASFASRRAVLAAIKASDATNISAGLIGVTVLAIGTDLPEIANSIIAALTDHGDVNVGDSAGSALTQVTLVLALLCLTAALRADRRAIMALGTLTVLALLLDALLIRDGQFSRLDGLVLVSSWVFGLVVTRMVSSPEAVSTPSGDRVAPLMAVTLGWLAVVAVASTVVVQSFVRLTDAVGVPELVASAVVLALGTSLPELVVDITALRRGAAALALGDLFGSSLLDATFAIGSGPALRATSVSSDAALTCVLAAVGVALATVLIASRREHRLVSAFTLLCIYAGTTAAIIVTTS
jgi:cation:H+ antiporter